MKRIIAHAAACIGIIACGTTADTVASPVRVTAQASYVLFGTVRDSGGAPISGANAQIVKGAYTGRAAISNKSGNFAFAGIAGALLVRISRDDYDVYQKTLDVTSDTAISVTMARLFLSDEIVIGRTVRASVSATAAPCDPARWDARAPCRRFYFTPTSTGVLQIEIKWDGQPELDATIVTPADDYVTSSIVSGSNRITMSANLSEGVTYEVRVNSYYGAQSFDLTANFAR